MNRVAHNLHIKTKIYLNLQSCLPELTFVCLSRLYSKNIGAILAFFPQRKRCKVSVFLRRDGKTLKHTKASHLLKQALRRPNNGVRRHGLIKVAASDWLRRGGGSSAHLARNSSNTPARNSSNTPPQVAQARQFTSI